MPIGYRDFWVATKCDDLIFCSREFHGFPCHSFFSTAFSKVSKAYVLRVWYTWMVLENISSGWIQCFPTCSCRLLQEGASDVGHRSMEGISLQPECYFGGLIQLLIIHFFAQEKTCSNLIPMRFCHQKILGTFHDVSFFSTQSSLREPCFCPSFSGFFRCWCKPLRFLRIQRSICGWVFADFQRQHLAAPGHVAKPHPSQLEKRPFCRRNWAVWARELYVK